jgi:site-specific recombinase XerC
MMQFDWILRPIAQYALLTLALSLAGSLALASCLALFLSMKRELALVRRALTDSRDSAAASAATLAAELAALRQDAESPDAAFWTGQELNLTRRAQALRMQRRGESPATIAAALRAPRNEIDLLLKIQEMANDHGQPLAADRHRSTQPS